MAYILPSPSVQLLTHAESFFVRENVDFICDITGS